MKSFICLIFCVLATFTAVNGFFNGQEAKPHSAPFMVNLQRRDNLNHIACGGAILTKNVIITSASCAEYEITIVAGNHNITLNEITIQKRTPIKIIEHPEANTTYNKFNIGLIYLNADFDFNDYVQPIVLPEIDECFSGETIGYGWGKFDSAANGYPNNLQQLKMPIIKRDLCRDSFPNDSPIHLTNICTGPLGAGQTMSAGDQGGPVVQSNASGRPYLVGIMLYYNSYFLGNGPNVHANVGLFRDFIDYTLNNN